MSQTHPKEPKDIIKDNNSTNQFKLSEQSISSEKISTSIDTWLGIVIKLTTILVGIFTCVITFMIREYLYKLGANDLYVSSVLSVNSLFSIVFVALLIGAALGFVFLIPTAFLMYFGNHSFTDKKIPKSFYIVYLLTPSFFFIFYWLNWNYSKSWSAEVFCGYASLTALICLIIPTSFQNKKTIITTLKDNLKYKIDFIMLFSFILYSLGIITLAFLASRSSLMEPLDNIYTRIRIIACSILILIANLLIIKVLNDRSSSKYTIPVFLAFLFYIVLVVPISFTNLILPKTGIFNDEKQFFFLTNDQLEKAVINELLTSRITTKEGAIREEIITQYFLNNKVFSAYTQYIYGGRRMLCKEFTDPKLIIKNIPLDQCLTIDDKDVVRVYQDRIRFKELYDDLEYKEGEL